MEKSSFFKSIAGDRKYKAEDFAAFFNSLLTNGVFPNPSSNLQVIANNNMTVTIKAGKAWINGYVYILDADMILPIEVADGVLKRIDRIVIRYSTAGRAILGGVRKGVFASTPAAPTLVRDADLYELGIADIYVANGAVSIVGANITDLRMNTSLCGWVNSLIQADTTAIFNQYQAWFTAQSNAYNTEMIANEAAFETQFNDWFATIQGQLSGDIAGNLAASISNLAGAGRTTETVKGNAAAIASLGSSVATSLAEMGSQAVGKGASLIGLNDSGNKFTATNVEGALNELFQNADNGQKSINAVIGSPVLSGDTYVETSSKLQILKSTMASNLTSKGQSSVGTESLTGLIDKIPNISTGKKWASGAITQTENLVSIRGLTFKPKIVILTGVSTSDSNKTTRMVYVDDSMVSISLYNNVVNRTMVRSDATTSVSPAGTMFSDGFEMTFPSRGNTQWIAYE